MILFPHMLVGAVIGAKIHSFPAIFIIALILHFAFDALPHWEYGKQIDLKTASAKRFFIFCLQAVLDFFIGALIIYLSFRNSPYFYFIVFGSTVSILPDFLVFLYCSIKLLFKFEFGILKRFFDFHHKIHTPKTKNSRLRGIAIESLILILSVFLLWR